MEHDGKQRNRREMEEEEEEERGEKEENLGQREQSRRGSRRKERGKINSSVFPQGHQQVTPAFPQPSLPVCVISFFSPSRHFLRDGDATHVWRPLFINRMTTGTIMVRPTFFYNIPVVAWNKWDWSDDLVDLLLHCWPVKQSADTTG